MNWAKEQARIETEKYEQEKENHCLPVIFHPNRKNPLQRSYGYPRSLPPQSVLALPACGNQRRNIRHHKTPRYRIPAPAAVPLYISPEAPSALKCCCSLLPFPYPCPHWRNGDTWQPLFYPFTPPLSLSQDSTSLSVPYHISDAP